MNRSFFNNFFRRNKLLVLLFVLLCILFFSLRIPNLILQPIFADEAIYIRWAQVMKAEPTLRFLPLSDGKTPLFMWAMMPFLKVFEDPLFAGRFLSILAGFTTMLGVLALGWKFFDKRVGMWSAFLITIIPYTVFFDRMALVDSTLAAFSVWSLFFVLLLVQYPRVDVAMFLGYFLGGGLLTKPPGFFNVLVLPFSLILFNWQDENRQNNLLRLFGLWVVAIIITFAIYNLLRLGPGFSGLSSRNQDYIFSPFDLAGRPLDPFIPHLRDLQDWFPKLLTIPTLLLVFLGMVLAFIKKNRIALVVLFWSLVPLLIQMAFLKTFTARYLLFSIPPLICLAGWAITQLIHNIKLKTLTASLLFIMILLVPSLYFNFKLITNPESAPLPRAERRGYLEDWTAGYGLKEIAQFLIDESSNGVVVVGTEGSFGTLPDGLQIYLDKHSHRVASDNQVLVIGGAATVSAELRRSALDHQTFFIANKTRYSQYESNLVLLKEYSKAKDGLISPHDSILFFKVLPIREGK